MFTILNGSSRAPTPTAHSVGAIHESPACKSRIRHGLHRATFPQGKAFSASGALFVLGDLDQVTFEGKPVAGVEFLTPLQAHFPVDFHRAIQDQLLGLAAGIH